MTTTPAPQVHPRTPSLRAIIAIVLFGTMINPLDGSMTVQALPNMAEDLQAAASLVMMTMSIYYLGSMASQPVMGRISDMFGARRIFIGGLGIVAVCSAAMLVAPTIHTVIGLRLLQSIGSAVAFPTGLSIVRSVCIEQGVSPDHSIGTITWVNSLAASLGPLFGGLLVNHLGWRGPSLLTLVASIAAVAGALVFLPKPMVPAQHSGIGRLLHIDFVGILTFVLSMSGIQLILTQDYGKSTTLIIALVSVVLVCAFVWRELHAREPFVNLRELSVRPRIIVVFAVYAAANLIFFSVLTGLPTWMQANWHLTPFSSGLATFPISITGVLITLVAGRVVYAQRQQRVMTCALVCMCIGSILMAMLAPVMTLPAIIAIAMMMASPNNISTLSLQTTLYTMIGREETGLYTGLFQTCRYLGASLATTLTSLTVASAHPGPTQLRDMGIVCAVTAGLSMAIIPWLGVLGCGKQVKAEDGNVPRTAQDNGKH